LSSKKLGGRVSLAGDNGDYAQNPVMSVIAMLVRRDKPA
jgi:hypothetical protein